MRAFSLIELSVVLVILGLLTGGILAGQSLIRASELRSVVTQRDLIVSATHAFRDKYFYLPGDMPNASSVWGLSAAGATCRGTTAIGTLTCNGDGDGRILNSTYSYEIFRFWQQLANAGLINGTYTGVGGASSASSHSVSGVNSMAGKIGKAGWGAQYVGVITADPNFLDISPNDNTLRYGYATTGSFFREVITPAEAWNIDTKIDDSMPGRGRVIGTMWSTCTDAVDSTSVNANYLLASDTIACGLLFRPF